MDKFIELKSGDKIQEGDEYSTGLNLWRVVPSFLIGDIIPQSSTLWRRPIPSNSYPDKKTNWFLSWFRKS